MANKTTVALSREEYEKITSTISNGFIYNRRHFKPNKQIATILTIQGNLGLRIGDVMSLSLNSFLRDGNRYRIDIIEEKTKKKREFTVPIEVYNFIKMYSLEQNLKPQAKLFTITERTVQRHLKYTCDYLGIERVSTHSFRKFFATQIYINSNYNIMLVKQLLQHANASTTQRYIGIQRKEVEEALDNHVIITI